MTEPVLSIPSILRPPVTAERGCIILVHSVKVHEVTKFFETWAHSCHTLSMDENKERSVHYSFANMMRLSAIPKLANPVLVLDASSETVGNSANSYLSVCSKSIVDNILTYLIHIPTPFMQSVASSNCHVLYIKKNRLYGFGSGKHNRLGVGGTSDALAPIAIPIETGPIGVAASSTASFVVDNCGMVWSWGEGVEGILGHGKAVRVMKRPSMLRALRSAFVVSLSASESHAVVVTHGGVMWAWGNGRYGRLGMGDEEHRFEPHIVPPPVITRYNRTERSGWIVYAYAAPLHTIALSAEGYVFACGHGQYGMLGRGDDTTDQHHLTAVPGMLDIKSIGGGLFFSVFLSIGGGVYSCGCGMDGRLGNGSELDQYTPKLVHGLPSVKAVTCGPRHGIATTVSGDIYAWGVGASGRLGTGNNFTLLKPEKVGSIEDATGQTVTADRHTMVQTVKGWRWAGVHLWGEGYGVDRAIDFVEVPM